MAGQKILTISAALILFSIFACDEKKQPQEYIAKVGNNILTEEGLENYLSQEKYANKFKNEFIREWVEEELLFLEAENSGFTVSKKYLYLLEIAKKQVAGSLLLEKYFNDNYSNPSDDQLKQLYDSMKESLILHENGYILNIVEFNDDKIALDFRNLAIQKSWEASKIMFENDSSLISMHNDNFLLGYNLSPLELNRTVKVLNPGEISHVIQKEPTIFAVVQMVDIINNNTVPNFNLVKDQIEEIYYSEKQKELYSNYLDVLYSKYNVELKKVEE